MTSKRISLRIAAFIVPAFAIGVLCPLSIDDAAAQSNGATQTRAHTRPTPRVRPRIRVTPAYPYRYESLPYPPPYDYEYPGPNAVRQCTARLVQEARPSGTVIVPRTTCWWERG